MRKVLFLLLMTYGLLLQAAPKKVACVGNSVTFGYGIENREVNSYPAQLQRLLGSSYQVTNFGHSGTTLLQKGHRPYTEQTVYQEALEWAADYVVIHLGLNDTDPRNWPHYQDDFVKDYLKLIESFRQANPHCQIWICRMTPISHRHPRFKSGTRDWYWQEQAAIEQIARLSHTTLIDLQAPLYNRPDLLPDALHPTAEGAALLAQKVYQALTGDYGGLQVSPIYTDRMVLQREQPLRMQGIANAGEVVTVRFRGQTVETTTSSDGHWSVLLDPMPALSKPATLSIATATRQLTFSEVWVGDVWLCSGQSNMAFRVNESVEKEQEKQRQYARKQPAIRLFDMKPRWHTHAVEWDASVLDSLNRLQYFQETQWSAATEEAVARFSAIGFAFGQTLADSLQVPIGLILNAVGGSPAEAWIDRKSLEFHFTDILYDWTNNDFIQDWVRGRARLNIKQASHPLQRHPYEPCYLFEAGIQPLQQFPIKGVIWYQGESNAHNIEAHEQLFPLLVQSWRNYWQRELPFYYVQLSSLNRPSWPHFRDSQRRLMDQIPMSGMAVSSDLGDSLDVHPRQKIAVGQRLALWALNRSYNRSTVPSGPLYRAVRFGQGAAYLSFDYADGLHSADGQPLRSFEVAAEDGLFYPAEAVIEGNEVKVWNDSIPHPRLVRYGWQPFTRANLVNARQLPASTFKTTYMENTMTWNQLPDLPGTSHSGSLGVSAPFAGVQGEWLLVAGGCNFPDKPVTEGGVKRYYDEIFLLNLAQPTQWKQVGKLPYPVAYGASVSTPEGLYCIGGNNSDSSLVRVAKISYEAATDKIHTTLLPSLPEPMDNLSATYAEGKIYVAGGNRKGKASHSFLMLNLSDVEKGWIQLADFPGAARVQPVLAAQQTAEGMRIYLAGGFQPGDQTTAPEIPTSLLSYQPSTDQWSEESTLPALADGGLRTLTGGCAVAWKENKLLLMGGVNYDRFLAAIDRPRQIAQARANGDEPLALQLEAEAKAYMHHPIDWYQFNTTLLCYDTFNRQWEDLGDHEQLARAGAAAVTFANQLIIVNGELKPGIRTPIVTRMLSYGK